MFFNEVSRRDWFKSVGLGVGAAALSSIGLSDRESKADFVSQKDKTTGKLLDGSQATPCTLQADGTIVRPSVSLPKISETDVLVVGAGPAGCCAAIAAARLGVKVTLVERYGHFGGLATGGLVLHILGHWTKQDGKSVQVVQGIGEEMMQRLEKTPNGIINRQFAKNPTLDAEAYKYLLVEMITEANIEVLLHSWCCDAIMADSPDPATGNPTVRGAVIQTKLGPQAIIAKQVVDTTGDGDVFYAAGAAHTQREYNIGLVSRIGNLDRINPPKDTKAPRHLGDAEPVKGVRWVNMQGPSLDGCDVRVLSQLELQHRKQIWKQVQEVRSTPGYEDVYLMETAPQIGVRITRVIEGVETLTLENAKAGKKYDDCVAIGGAWNGDHIGWQIPYRALLPKNVENIITAGRSLSAEPLMSDVVRVYPNCWASGHAAGVAAAVAAKSDVTARAVDISEVRRNLLAQKAYLG
ncbi:MAG: FAD-dependent oxidoreductase [Thermoguttaceae bacterium]|nr:FAD-dependent oxidoreductase [Thermoguttaceae bacterium]